MAKPSECNDDTIEQFLTDLLPAGQLHAFEQHLSDCADCQQRLREQSAGQAWWQHATEFLSADSYDIPLNETQSANAELREAESQGALTSDPSWAPTQTGDTSLPLEHDGLRRVLELLAPSEDSRYAGRLGRYDIVGAIGFGGMAVVLKGFEATLNRYVAIKIMAPHLASLPAARERFSREARAAASVLHPNVIAIHSVSEFEGLPYLVMPYIAGGSLQDRLNRQGPLDVESAVRVGMQVAAGLAAAHTQGLVHRDIKPANILLEPGTRTRRHYRLRTCSCGG